MNQQPYNNQQPHYYPNGYPPNPGQFFYPPTPPPSSRRYSNRLLIILCIAYVLAWLCSFIGDAVAQGQANFLFNLGISLFFGILTCLLILDWRGTVSLQGLIHWRRCKFGKRILIGFLCFVVFPFLLTVYFVRTFRLYQRTPRASVQGTAPTRSKRSAVGLIVGSIVTLFALIFVSAGGMTNAQQTVQTTSSSSVGTSPSPTTTTIVKTSQARATTGVATAIPTTVPSRVSQPTQVPTQPIQPTPVPSLSLVFTGANAVDYSQGIVGIHTLPGAALTITVTYCSGHEAVSNSLRGTSYADGGGNHTWTWIPETKCRGTATADVIASDNGQSIEQADNFTVQ